MSEHKDFILMPITKILHEVISANYAIGNGMETFPLSEHIFQSTFLRMTGAQEQKMKCICWEIATIDYEYRYYRYNQNTLGECSSYAEKKSIFKDLLDAIHKYEPNYDVSTAIGKSSIRISTIDDVKTVFVNSNLSIWAQSSFLDFTMNNNTWIKEIHFAVGDKLFENVLQDKYSLLYRHRNRCAHNTFSYQQNLPTLAALLNENHRYDNYVMRFALLILIDKIFIALYQKYLIVIE